MKDKILVNCSDGINNTEKATVAFILAFTASKTHETAVFLTADGVQLALKGGAEEVRAEGYEPLADLLHGMLANGGKLWICPACAKARGITGEDLVEGAEIAGAPRTLAYLAEGAKTLV